MGVKYADGAEVFYDAKAHKLSVNAPDSELSIACKKLNVEGEVNITGDTTVTGEITASVEVTAGTQKIINNTQAPDQYRRVGTANTISVCPYRNQH